MGNTLKLISGIILFIFGIFLVYETYANNLIDLLLFAGFIVTIIGIILIIGYFVDSSADKTRDFISDLAKSSDSSRGLGLGETRSEGFSNPFKSNKSSYNTSQGPLTVRNNYFDDESDPIELKELDFDDFDRNYAEDSYLERASRLETPVNTDKAVLNIVDEETEVNFDNKLNFTPNYDRPLKITRKPKKREEEFFDDRYIYYGAVEDKTDDISRALYEDTDDVIIPQHNIPETASLAQEPEREIKIDINNPESLPVPKLLKSYVVCKGGIVTSQEAFELLVANVQKEVMLEIPTLNGLSEQFIANIPSIYSRVIIEDFNLSDLSSLVLISSFLKQGVQVKTIPKVNTINLITDDSYALIISESNNVSDIEYGAIYTDIDSISEIRISFDTIWEMANELDENRILQQVNGGY